jgi:hypothetical protein
MPLGNWVMFDEGVPERLHFLNHYLEDVPITDRSTGLPSTRRRLVLDVDRHNGRKANAKLSVLAEGFFAQLEPYLEGNAYRDYDFVITQTGRDFLTKYSVQVIPIK